VSRMCAKVGNTARMTHDQTRGQVYFPASQGVAGELGNSPNLSAILAIFEKLYFRFIFYAVAGEEKGERAPIPRNPTLRPFSHSRRRVSLRHICNIRRDFLHKNVNAANQPETKYRGLSRESTPGDRKALAWLEQQVKPAWSNQELCSE
jgi:hypothetical protein